MRTVYRFRRTGTIRMKTENRREILRMSGGLLLTLMTGCSLIDGPRSDMVPGIAFPSERTKTMEELARRAEKEGPEAQERLAAEMLEHFPQEKDPIVRGDILRTVGRFQTASSYQLLQIAVRDPDETTRIRACRAMATWKGSEEMSTVLCRTMLGDTSRDVRLEAARAVAEVGHPGAEKSLAESLEESDPAMQNLAVAALRRISPQDYGDDPALWRAHLRGESVEPPSTLTRLWNQLRR
ncbi:MAG: HEAT repeat domain-containing protein [Planctomycetia bacterium]|nr:HEAT repeat domain-containing protein [Planctomycetia bacterium]